MSPCKEKAGCEFKETAYRFGGMAAELNVDLLIQMRKKPEFRRRDAEVEPRRSAPTRHGPTHTPVRERCVPVPARIRADRIQTRVTAGNTLKQSFKLMELQWTSLPPIVQIERMLSVLSVNFFLFV